MSSRRGRSGTGGVPDDGGAAIQGTPPAGLRRSEPGRSGTGVTVLLSTIRGHVNREARASSANHGHRAVRLRRRSARVRLPQGHHRRGHRRLGRDLRLAHVRVARDRARGHGPAAHRRGPAPDRADERADLVRRPAGRPGAHEGPRRDRPRALGHQGEVARRARSTSCSAACSATGSRSTGRTSRRTGRSGPRSSASRRPRTYAEWAAGARDVVAQGYKVLKTNLIAEGGPDGKARLPRYLDGAIDNRTIDDAVTWIGTLRDVVGPGDRHRGRRPVRLPDGRHRQARPGARAVRPVLAGGREPRPGRAAGGPRADDRPGCATARASSGASSSGRSSRSTSPTS